MRNRIKFANCYALLTQEQPEIDMDNRIREALKTYRIEVFYSAEDEGYIATCPAFPGHSAFGDTPDEAVREGFIALELLIETYIESDEALPTPEIAA